MAEHVAAGDRAFVDEEYEIALNHYSKALESEPSSAVYEARANANLKLERYVDAVQDATKAIGLDAKNAKAYLRKGTACFHLEEYETALQCFEQGQQLAPDTSQFRTWISKCKAELDGEAELVGGATTAAVAKATPAPAPAAAARAAPTPAAAELPAPTPAAAEPPAAAPVAAEPPAAPVPAAAHVPAAASSGTAAAIAPAAPQVYAGKYRHQWYQIGNKVVVDVYAKNQPKDAVSVTISGEDNNQLRIVIAAQPSSNSSSSAATQVPEQQQQQQEEEDYVLELQLFAGVVPEQLKVEVLKTKVEVAMAKAQPNKSWPSLEKGAVKGAAAAAGVGVAAAAAVAPEQQGAPRAYPSSRGPKDWSKVEAEVKELEDKGELDDGDPLNAFFKKIFAGGDEDTRRAMMKSFVESNGTVLSTNWKEVGAKKIECTPPEGMELHKWSES